MMMTPAGRIHYDVLKIYLQPGDDKIYRLRWMKREVRGR